MNSSFVIFAIFGSTIVSGSIGIVVGFFVGRRWSTNDVFTSAKDASEGEKQNEKFKLETMMDSLHDLTNEVGEQVGTHSCRVNEITQSLDAPKSDDLDEIRLVGKSLITANRELESALKKAKEELNGQSNELRRSIREARTDVLTGLPNRRAFDQELARSIAAYRRNATPFSLVMLDIDHFKRLNDQHGHLVGDQVLKSFASCLTRTFRDGDFVSRFGGEEFAAILPKTTLEDVLRTAERARNAIAEYQFSGGDVEFKVTASIGVKEIGPDEANTDLIKKADEALYAAKRSGRNCCWFHDGFSIQKFNDTALIGGPMIRHAVRETVSVR